MNMSEEKLQVQNIFIIDNVEYVMDSEIDINPRIEDVFTPSELRSGRENSFEFLDLSINNYRNEERNIVEVLSSNTNDKASIIPTYEINDSDEDVIFVSEYANDTAKKNSQKNVPTTGLLPLSNIRGDDSSFGSTSSEAAEVSETNEPRRNPRRSTRSKKFKKKFSEYITEEDLNVFMESDEEKVVALNEPTFKEIRTKKVVPRNWPAEGLHERPEYNEETGKIERFDCTIREIEKKLDKVVLEKPKALKTLKKKKAIPKKINAKKGRRKSVTKKEKVELVPYNDLKGIINEVSNQLNYFVEIVNDCKQRGLHTCQILPEKEDDVNLENTSPHQKCNNDLNELLSYQSQLYFLANTDKDFFCINDSLKIKVVNSSNNSNNVS